MSDYYTWKSFKDLVRTLLPLDSKRLGLSDYIDQMTRLAVIDMMDYIPRYLTAHESVYYSPDFVQEGHASKGSLPPSSIIKDRWVFDFANHGRRQVINYPWDQRFNLIYGKAPCRDDRYRMAIDPQDQTFYIYPAITDRKALSIFWDGFKLEFSNDDQVPFEEGAAQAAADYVAAKIARYVERDNVRYESLMRDYTLKKRNLHLANR